MDDSRLPTEERAIAATVVAEEQIVLIERREAPFAPERLRHAVARLLLDRVRSMATLLVIAVFALTFIVQPFRIPSASMERTLLVGDFLLVNKAIYGPEGKWGWLLPYRAPRRGDIVVFRFPLNPEEHVVKRVIGAEGDGIHLRNGVVYRNGLPLTEAYTAQPRSALQAALAAASPATALDSFRDNFPAARFLSPEVDAHWWTTLHDSMKDGDVVVPARQYFVMGDNRENSRDSRYWGFVPRANIVGLPMLIYFSVRGPSRSSASSFSLPSPLQIPQPEDDKLGESKGNGLLDFARWERTLRVVY